jgi:hypothetical protein
MQEQHKQQSEGDARNAFSIDLVRGTRCLEYCEAKQGEKAAFENAEHSLA